MYIRGRNTFSPGGRGGTTLTTGEPRATAGDDIDYDNDGEHDNDGNYDDVGDDNDDQLQEPGT